MSFFEPGNLRAVLGGRWLRRVPVGTLLAGVGTDTREDLHEKIFVAIAGERHDGHDHLPDAIAAGAGLLIVHRQPAGDLPGRCGVLLVDETVRALGRLAAAYRRSLPRTRVIAVTGTAGKTTTKTLIHAILAQTLRGSAAPRSFNNQIGVPLTLLGANAQDDYVVVEIGTNAPGEVGALSEIAAPDVAVITLVGRGHLQGLGDLEAVAREKLAILGALRPEGLAILNADCPQLRVALRAHPRAILYGESEDAHLRLTRRGKRWFEVNARQRFAIGLAGRHNAINALAALAVARRFGIDDETVGAALRDTTALPMRLARLDLGPQRLYNDAYNANPESMAAALETFVELEASAQRRVLVLGEMQELGEHGPDLHRQLADRIIEIDRRAPIDHVVLIGDLTGHTATVLRRHWGPGRVTKRKATARARAVVRDVVAPADAVLVKGSRAVGLERMVDWLSTDFREVTS